MSQGGCPCSWNGNCSKHGNIGNDRNSEIIMKEEMYASTSQRDINTEIVLTKSNKEGGCPCSWNGNCTKHGNIGNEKLELKKKDDDGDDHKHSRNEKKKIKIFSKNKK